MTKWQEADRGKEDLASFEVIAGESGASEAGWSSIESALRCLKEFQLREVRGVHKPLQKNPDYFSVGSLLHAMRAKWFALKFKTDAKSWQLMLDACQEEIERQKLPVALKAELAARLYFEQYVEYWAPRPRPTPIAVEYKLGPAPLKPDDPFFFYRTARLDDVSKYPEAGGALCLGEVKTTSASVNDVINQYTLHGQTMLQLVLWRSAMQGEKKFGKAAGIMLDVIGKGYGGKKCSFARQFIPVTERALTWFTQNMRAYLRAIAAIDWNADAPRNVSACTRLIGRARVACEFRQICIHGRSATQDYVLRDGKSLLTWKPDGERQVPPWE
jgi:hypothetical protein